MMHSVLDFFQDGVLSFCVSVFKTENPVRQTVNKISAADYNKSSPTRTTKVVLLVPLQTLLELIQYYWAGKIGLRRASIDLCPKFQNLCRSDACWGVPSPNPAERCGEIKTSPPQSDSPKKRGYAMSRKSYATNKWTYIIKTRVSEEQYQNFVKRCAEMKISQSDFIWQKQCLPFLQCCSIWLTTSGTIPRCLWFSVAPPWALWSIRF